MQIGRLVGKVAFISAAGNGIGRETALAFAREGAEVLATDIDAGLLAALGRENRRISTQVLDVTEPNAVADVIARRNFNVVFNCAGWVHQGTIEECSIDAW